MPKMMAGTDRRKSSRVGGTDLGHGKSEGSCEAGKERPQATGLGEHKPSPGNTVGRVAVWEN